MTKRTKKWLLGSSALLIVFACAAIAHLVLEGRKQAHEKECFENIKRIDASIESCALAYRWGHGGSVQMDQLLQYFPNGLPSCPSGGQYIMPTVGSIPSCTVHKAMCARIRVDKTRIRTVAKRAFALYLEEKQ